MKIILTLILAFIVSAAFSQKPIKYNSTIYSNSGSFDFTGTSFNGTYVTKYSDSTVQVGDYNKEFATRDKNGKWNITDTLATIKQLYKAVEIISKYDEEQGELHAAACGIVDAYLSGNKLKIIGAYKRYNKLLKHK